MDKRHVNEVIAVDVNYLWIQDTLMESFLLMNEADGRRRLSVVAVISCLLLLLLSLLLTLERFITQCLQGKT